MVAKKKVVKSMKKKIAIKRYDIDNRCDFIDKIRVLRLGNRKIPPMSYKLIAKTMNSLGFRNRNRGIITEQFIGNILHRHVEL